MAGHFTLTSDPFGGGSVTVNGQEVSALIEGAELVKRPGQTALHLHLVGSAEIEGEGVIYVHPDDADTQAEVGALLRTLDGHTLWEAMMADPTVDLSDLATAFLHYVADAVDPQP